ncbi:bifunctional sulfate adenylyltransferase/adenylylsulfate kinase [bacterium]|nr:bifunctional sulfate adenylyltransferase/adenylylsulfate kinase [bacterium]
MPSHLIEPHGGELVDLVVSEARGAELNSLSLECPSWDLTPRQMCDLELLAVGGFSPLRGFMGREDYESVCERMRLADGAVWPIPIVLDLPEELAGSLELGALLALRDPEGVMLAALTVEETWTPDRAREAEQVYGAASPEHPGVAYLLEKTHPCCVSGRLEVVQLPSHYDFVQLRQTPLQLREQFGALGWQRVVAFQTRNPMHCAHQELTFRAARENEACLLVHPVVGMTKPGDIDHYTRVRCYEALMPHYPHGTAALSLLPLGMRMAGPREAVWHAVIRKNYGCTHLIVGRDHAEPGGDSDGAHFYGPYDAQALLREFEDEIGIAMVPFRMVAYVPARDEYLPEDEVAEGAQTLTLSGTDLRERLADGRDIPDWFSFPEVIQELRRSHPTRSRRGFTVLFSGLPSSGKSTVANVLQVKLLEAGGRPVTLFDGDIVRKNLSSELTFSKEHRDLNIRRIGFVASEITKNGGIAICAPIAPYDAVRKEVRELVGSVGGGFILGHVATPVETCEQRDRKGLYAKARAGIVKAFTGISDPYEEPLDADVVFDTTDLTPEACAQQVILHLEKEGYIGLPGGRNA